MANLFNSGGLQGLALMASAMSNKPGNFFNTLQMLDQMDQRTKAEAKEAKKEASALNYLKSSGAMNGRVGDIQQAPEIADQVFGGFGPQTDTSQIELMKAVGAENLLNSKLSTMQPDYKAVDGIGLVDTHAKGGPKVVIAPGPKAPQLDIIYDEQGREQKVQVLPDGTLKKIGGPKAQSGAEEPLVQIPDPNDPTQAILVPRSQAIGKHAFQTQRERMPKMQTYYDEYGRQIQLDSNDPDDQKRIRAEGLVTAGPSDTERTSLGFVNRMNSAEGILSGLVTGGYKPGGLRDKVAGGTPLVGNFAMSDEGQAYRQAQEDWVRAKLRKESGAVIGSGEMADEIKTYFPQPGDNATTIAQKEKSRVQAQRQLATTAGILGKPILRTLDAGVQAAPAVAQASPGAPNLPPGMVRQVGTYQGKPVYVDAQGQRHVAQ